MRKEDLDQCLKRQPFRPFRLTTTIGETYDIHHPDMMITSRSVVAVGLPESGHEEQPYSADTLVMLSLIHLVKIEPLTESARSRNGKKKGK
jgi:hypothetical protein